MITFLFPVAGANIISMVLNALNIILLIGSCFFFAHFLNRSIEKSTGTKRPVIAVVSSAVIVIGLSALSIYATQGLPGQEISEQSTLWLLLTVLDPVLGISTMGRNPFPLCTGLNMLVRVGMLIVIAVLLRKAYEATWSAASSFADFLDKNVYKKKSNSRAVDSEETPTDEGEKPADGKEAPSEDRKNISAGLRILGALSPLASGIVGLFGYIFGTDDTRAAILDILKGIWTFLDATTLTSQIKPDAAGTVALLSNFLFTILSICILTIYAAMLAILIIFVVAAIKHHKKLIDWVVKNAKRICLFFLVIALLVLACTAVFVVGSGFQTVRDTFDKMFAIGSPNAISLAASFILLILIICIAMLMLGFAITFAIFVAYFGYQSVKKGIGALRNSQNILHYMKAAAAVVVGIGILLGFLFGYDEIRTSLESLFLNDQVSTPLWVLGHTFLILAVLLGLSFAVLLTLTVSKVVLFGLGRLVSTYRENTDQTLAEKLVDALLKLFHLIPFTLRKLCEAARSFLDTILRIFIGYNTESAKNKALFVAAGFASLASLLNTFFGLRDFYQSDENIIPIICSLAIACAVQLAMLIFGMKGGEGIADSMMTDDIQQRQGYTRMVISKVFRCILYLLVYLTVLVSVVSGFILRKDSGGNLGAMLPILFIVLATVAFAYSLALQILDIRTLWKDKKNLKNKGTEDPVYVSAHRPKRILPRFYLTAYFLLMIVSTGFAFNNLFGYYADRAQIHQQVYDQVRDEAVIQLELNDRVTATVFRYNENTNEVLKELTKRTTAANQKQSTDQKTLWDYVTSLADTYTESQNELDKYNRATTQYSSYLGNTGNFKNTAAALKTYLNMDYDAIGNENTITVYSYDHYWGDSSLPFYTTSCIEMQKDNTTVASIGPKIENENKKTSVTTDYGTFTLVGRYQDPDSERQSVAITKRIIKHADKYDLLVELLSLFDEQEAQILNFDASETTTRIQNGGETNQTSANTRSSGENSNDIRTRLEANAILDGVRRNVAQLSGEDDPVSILELPRVMNGYMTKDTDAAPKEDGEENAQNDGTGKKQVVEESTPKKVLEYQQLSDYIDRALTLNDLLAEADAVLNDSEQPTGQTGEDDVLAEQAGGDATPQEQKQEPKSEDSPAYTVRMYRNYAQAIAHSNFQISYDALFLGNFGLNPKPDKIDALYRSSIVALFMLLICALVDLMAFFAGLLLFKDVFMLERNKKLDKLGYMNYEAVLTNLFALPDGENESLLHLAVIYRLLYGDPAQNHSQLPDLPGNTAQLHAILNSKDVNAAFDAIWAVLEDLELTRTHLPDLRLWLGSFVKKNDIKFDRLFSTSTTPPTT